MQSNSQLAAQVFTKFYHSFISFYELIFISESMGTEVLSLKAHINRLIESIEKENGDASSLLLIKSIVEKESFINQLKAVCDKRNVLISKDAELLKRPLEFVEFLQKSDDLTPLYSILKQALVGLHQRSKQKDKLLIEFVGKTALVVNKKIVVTASLAESKDKTSSIPARFFQSQHSSSSISVEVKSSSITSTVVTESTKEYDQFMSFYEMIHRRNLEQRSDDIGKPIRRLKDITNDLLACMIEDKKGGAVLRKMRAAVNAQEENLINQCKADHFPDDVSVEQIDLTQAPVEFIQWISHAKDEEFDSVFRKLRNQVVNIVKQDNNLAENEVTLDVVKEHFKTISQIKNDQLPAGAKVTASSIAKHFVKDTQCAQLQAAGKSIGLQNAAAPAGEFHNSYEIWDDASWRKRFFPSTVKQIIAKREELYQKCLKGEVLTYRLDFDRSLGLLQNTIITDPLEKITLTIGFMSEKKLIEIVKANKLNLLEKKAEQARQWLNAIMEALTLFPDYPVFEAAKLFGITREMITIELAVPGAVGNSLAKQFEAASHSSSRSFR